MTSNFNFCNRKFLPFFCQKFASFYNQFYNCDLTANLIDTVGEHPNYRIDFRYNDEKHIRATFITFDDAEKEPDVKSICVLFQGHRFRYHCYFYELLEDGTLGCVEVASPNSKERIVRYSSTETDIDERFDRLCSFFDVPEDEAVAMIFYNEPDDCFRILDIGLDELKIRSKILLGAPSIKSVKTYDGIDFIVFRNDDNGGFLAARTIDGENIANALLSDIDFFRS